MRTHRFKNEASGEILEVALTPLPDGRVSARVVRVMSGVPAGTGPSTGTGPGGEPERRSERVLEFDARRVGDHHFLARLSSGEINEARLESEPGGGPGRIVRFGPDHVALEWLDPFAVGAHGKGAGLSGPRKIIAPIPGRVVSISVSVGDAVEAGQSVVVVEAMKMANELRSPVAGRVKSINVKPGDKVDAGATLIVIEPV